MNACSGVSCVEGSNERSSLVTKVETETRRSSKVFWRGAPRWPLVGEKTRQDGQQERAGTASPGIGAVNPVPLEELEEKLLRQVLGLVEAIAVSAQEIEHRLPITRRCSGSWPPVLCCVVVSSSPDHAPRRWVGKRKDGVESIWMTSVSKSRCGRTGIPDVARPRGQTKDGNIIPRPAVLERTSCPSADNGVALQTSEAAVKEPTPVSS